MEDRRTDRSLVRVEAVRKQLEQVAREGEFKLMLLQDDTGHVLEQVDGTDDDHEKDLASFHRVLTGFKALLTEHMSLHRPEEAAVVAMDGHRLVCRFLEYGDSELLLIIVTRGRQAPRDLVDRAVQGIQRILTALDV